MRAHGRPVRPQQRFPLTEGTHSTTAEPTGHWPRSGIYKPAPSRTGSRRGRRGGGVRGDPPREAHDAVQGVVSLRHGAARLAGDRLGRLIQALPAGDVTADFVMPGVRRKHGADHVSAGGVPVVR